MSALDQANNPRRLVLSYGDSAMSLIAFPYSTMLDGVPGWVPSDRLSLPLHGLMVSRYRGERASPQHRGDRNRTCTESQVIKDLAVSVPNPWPENRAISRERVALDRDRRKCAETSAPFREPNVAHYLSLQLDLFQ